MNPEQLDDAEGRRADDEDFADRLAALDEALEAGESPELAADDVDTDLRDRLARGAACLDQLKQLWPHRRPLGEGDTQVSAEDPDTAREFAGEDIEIPEKLGRFHIRRELGRGGNGIVFLAYDPNLGRDVALKVPHLDVMINADLRERFFQESRAAAGLDHPNVVPVFEAGEIGPVCYIASAYCPGPTLASWLRQREEPVPFDVAAGILAKLADAVEHAHGRGVLHRDLKPSNVLLAQSSASPAQGEDGEDLSEPAGAETRKETPLVEQLLPRITDFGLAKVTNADAKATRNGTVMGTPAYMAPEQASGKNDQIGPAADVYALGTILYEMITGRPPFQGETPLEILIQVRSAEPIAPSRLRPRTPRDLETICRKCLEKDPHRRYQSAGQLADDLRRFLAGEPIQARPVGHIERSWRWCRRRPLVAGLLVALMIVLAGGFAGIYWQWRRAEDRAQEAIQERQTARRQQERAEQTLLLSINSVDRFFTNVSENVLLDRPGTQKLRQELLEAARHYYEHFLRHNRRNPKLHLELAQAQLRVGILSEDLGASAEACMAFERALASLKHYVAKAPADVKGQRVLAKCEEEFGASLRSTGDPQRALTLLDQAATRLGKLYAANPNDIESKFLLGATLFHTALSLTDVDEDTRAVECCERAGSLLEELVVVEPDRLRNRVVLMGIYNAIALHGYRHGQMISAITAFEKALSWAENLSPSVAIDGQRAMVYCNLGNAYSRMGRRDQASLAYQQANKILPTLVRDNPGSSVYQTMLAATYQNLGRFARGSGNGQQALVCHRRAEQFYTKLSQMHPEVTAHRFGIAKSKLGQGYALKMLKRPQEALAAFQAAREVWEQLAVENPNKSEFAFLAANCFLVAGTLHSQRSEWDMAISCYRKAITRHEKLLKTRPQDVEIESAVGAALNDLGLTLIKTEQYDDALSAVQQAIAHQQIAFDAAPTVAQYRKYLSNHYANLIRVLRAMHHWDQALQACHERRDLWTGNALELMAVSREMIRIAVDIDATAEGSPTDIDAEVLGHCIDEALSTLDNSIRLGFNEVAFLEKDAIFQSLHDNKRFQDLLDEMKSRQQSVPAKLTPRT